jgi:hypothetical protein
MLRLPVMASSLLLLGAASAAAATPLQCGNSSSWFHDRGMTKKDFTTFSGVESAGDCCAQCSSNASCVAWTYHSRQALCEIAPFAVVVMGADKISGSKEPPPAPGPPAPGPDPPPPPLPPHLPPPHPPLTPTQPNIVLVLQDDQDLYMGAWDGRGTATKGPMRQASHLIGDRGATASNWFIHTPVCCPSRSEILSGKYLHNIRVGSAKDGGCMHVDEGKVNPVSFAYYLHAAGYVSAYFGKHLNTCPRAPPPGFDCPGCRWFAYGGDTVRPWGKGGGYVNSAFNDYTDGVPAPAGEFYHPATGIYQANNTHGEFSGYSASIIANKSIGWIREAAKGGKPWMVTIGNRAPHAPFTPAPWYAEGSGEASAWIDKLIAPRCVCRAVMIRS